MLNISKVIMVGNTNNINNSLRENHIQNLLDLLKWYNYDFFYF